MPSGCDLYIDKYFETCVHQGSFMGPIMICGPLAEDYAAEIKMRQLNVGTVYGVLFSPLRLKFVPDWPAISVSS